MAYYFYMCLIIFKLCIVCYECMVQIDVEHLLPLQLHVKQFVNGLPWLYIMEVHRFSSWKRVLNRSARCGPWHDINHLKESLYQNTLTCHSDSSGGAQPAYARIWQSIGVVIHPFVRLLWNSDISHPVDKSFYTWNGNGPRKDHY